MGEKLHTEMVMDAQRVDIVARGSRVAISSHKVSLPEVRSHA